MACVRLRYANRTYAGYVLLGQPIGAHVVLGAALVVSGIWLVNRTYR